MTIFLLALFTGICAGVFSACMYELAKIQRSKQEEEEVPKPYACEPIHCAARCA